MDSGQNYDVLFVLFVSFTLEAVFLYLAVLPCSFPLSKGSNTIPEMRILYTVSENERQSAFGQVGLV